MRLASYHQKWVIATRSAGPDGLLMHVSPSALLLLEITGSITAFMIEVGELQRGVSRRQ